MTVFPGSPSLSNAFRGRIERPILIVSTPRSGSTLLYETLAKAPALYSVGSESHLRIEQVANFFPGARGWTSNRLDATDATDDAVEELSTHFYLALRDREGHTPVGPARMLEKTPKNALRVPFFVAAWPESSFIYLYRDVRQTLGSMMEAWASGRFRTYPRLPGWTGYSWSLLLVPGWRDLIGLSLPEVVAHQWAITTEVLLDDLEQLPSGRVRALEYDRLIGSPQSTMERLANSLDLQWDQQLGDELPLSKVTVSRPDANKWRRLETAIEAVIPIVEKADDRARKFASRLA